MRHNFFGAEKFFDYWSVSHFLFGTVMALFAITFSLSAVGIFLATLSLAICWELLERHFRLREARGNSVSDVLLALFSFCITYFLINRSDPNPEHSLALFMVAGILYLCVNFFAWRARFDHDHEFRG